MADEKRIRFSAEGGELTSFMRKLQSDYKSMHESFSNEAAKQTKNQKEQYKTIEDQLKAAREFLKVQKEITQEKIKQAKSVLSGLGDTFEDRAERVASERKIKRLENELSGIKVEDSNLKGAQDINRSNKPKEEKEKSVFADILRAGFIRDISGLLKNSVVSQTGLDVVSPFAQIMGGISGGLVGAGADAIAGAKVLGTGAGQTNFSAMGMQFGKDIAGMAADAVVRHFRTLDQFQAASFGFNAIGGGENGVNMSGSGFDSIAVKEAMIRASIASGSTNGASGNSAMMLALQRGYGIGEGDTLAAFGMQRSGGGNVKQNVQRALGVGISEGLDRSRFSDAIKTQTALLQKFSETKTNVSAADATRLMYEFNRMGGMFSVGDPRSLANIERINSGLSSPNSVFGQAQNYAVLRSLNPNASMWELKKMEEQGLQTPGFLQGVMKQIRSGGGSEDYQKFIAQSRFGLSGESVDRLFSMGGKINSMSSADLNKFLSDNKIKTESEKYTTTLQKNAAEVTDAFKESFNKGIAVIETQFENQFKRGIDEIAQYFEHKLIGDMEGRKYIPIQRGAKTPQRKGYTRMASPPNIAAMGTDSVDIKNDN